ncbi:hypothetical protein [Geomicrobium sediminis]|uniref:NEAT domain-containing protein n=1 Tax=Geomicrobium sediminis TaxID=1347788 RepID=A0ABS2PEM4_9BACL|nr:hypothetical protein [Geomicrobium sediminis]MBM7633879.1 hypothetical protein [Geomicrobium sediminis]
MITKPSINAIVLSMNTFDSGRDFIITNPISVIDLDILPNNFSFKINFSLTNLTSELLYNVSVIMKDPKNVQVMTSHMDDMKIGADTNEKLDVFATMVTLDVNNHKFSIEGNYTISIKIASSPKDKDHNEEYDEISIVVPVFDRSKRP